jgi:2-methylisocitrate lyase-like PEP mutase family enzyme
MVVRLRLQIKKYSELTTYEGPSNVYRSVAEYIRSGVAGFHIEDQVQTKRCGHLANKQIVPLATYVTRIKAALAARTALNSNILIIARTDALASQGYDEALKRLLAARDAGADVGFLEGVGSEEMMARVVENTRPWPMLLNMVEGGLTPTVSLERAKEIGFKIIILPFAGLAPAVHALREAYGGLRKTGLTQGEKISPKEVFELCGLNDWMEVDKAA